MRFSSKRCRVAIPLWILLLLAKSGALAQAPSTPPVPGIGGPATQEQAPFDKLELFGFFAAGPTQSYAHEVIRSRGANFAPDQNFISAFPIPGFQELLRDVNPRTAGTTAREREMAYAFLRAAYSASQHKQFSAASENFQSALQLAPNSATLHLAYAASCLLSGSYPVAETQARQSIRLWPGNAEAHGVLALALIAEKHFAEATTEARETLQIFPQHPSAKFELGVALARDGQFDAAIPVLRDAIAMLPKMAMLRKMLGYSLLETGKLNAAIEELNLYVKAAPDDPEGFYYLGVTLRSKDRSEEALAQFKEALRLQPNNPQYRAAAHPDESAAAPDAESGPKPEDGSVSENLYTNKFLGFSYTFPTGWTVMNTDARKAMVEKGNALLSTGDPTEVDIKKAAARQGHSLLFVMERHAGGEPISAKFIRVSAVDMRAVPGLSPAEFLKSVAEKLKRSGLPIDLRGAPEAVEIGGRRFWRGSFIGRTMEGTRYESQFVTGKRGFLVMFVASAPDLPALHQLEESFESIKFAPDEN